MSPSDCCKTASASTTTTTWYLGSVEKVVGHNGSFTYKRYLTDHSLLIEHYSSSGQLLNREENYLLKDHLGSIDVIMAADGIVRERLGFDAWGQRRLAATGAVLGSVLPSFASRTTRGYTGHEMVDSMGIIHMNGRIYDPKLGRFLQADPILQFPGDTQSYNRYSYVLNNPLKYNDPSGHIIPVIFGAIMVAAGAQLTTAAIVVFWMTASLAVANGASWGEALKSGVIAGVSFYAFGQIGNGNFAGMEFGSLPSQALGMGIVGGITSTLQGGKFGHGFIAAGAGGYLGGKIGGLGGATPAASIGRTAARVVLGGTISKVTGGKFANGAAYAAFAVIVSSGARAAANKLADEESVRFGDLNEVSAEESEALFKEAKQRALSLDEFANVDPEKIQLDNRYALENPKTGETEHFTDFHRASRARSAGYGIVGGEELNGNITVFRTAFAADIKAVNLGGSRFESFGFGSINRGIDTGVFVIGHEIGHLKTSSEVSANFAGLRALRNHRGY